MTFDPDVSASTTEGNRRLALVVMQSALESREGCLMKNVIAVFGNPEDRTALAPFNWLRTSKYAAVAWLAVRVWVGIMWIQAG